MFRRSLFVVLICCFCVNLSFASEEQASSSALDQARSISEVFRQVAQETLPATVKIVIKKGNGEQKSTKSKLPFGELLPDLPDDELIEGAGSGFIIDPSGIVVTNEHVVKQNDLGKSISVELNDGRRFYASKIVKDDKADVAIILIDSNEELPSLSFADSDAVEIGDWVLAIGNPFMLGSSVSAGIISAKKRRLGESAQLFFQTDAAINPGNSGGPLVNLNGKVVGINTAIASKNGAYQGIGFALPSNTAQWIVSQLQTKGKVERAFLGASVSSLEYDEARRLSLPLQTGVQISMPFKDSPAANAGLRAKDIILELDGQSIDTPQTLEALVEQTDVEINHTLKVLRNNSKQPVDVPIRFMIKPEGYVGEPLTEKLLDKGAHYMDKEWGLMLIPSTPESAARAGAKDRDGLIALNVTPGGSAYKAGIRSGALITSLNDIEIKSFEDYETQKLQAPENEKIKLGFFQKSELKEIQLARKNK